MASNAHSIFMTSAFELHDRPCATSHADDCGTVALLPPPQVLRFSHRSVSDTQVAGDKTQGTMGRRKMRDEAPYRPFSPSRLPPLRANLHRERDLRWVGQVAIIDVYFT